MKQNFHKISALKKQRMVKHFVSFVTLALLISSPESYGMSTPYVCGINGLCNSAIKPSRPPRRLFKTLSLPEQDSGVHSQKVLSNSVSPFEITYQDLIDAYSPVNDLEYYSSDQDYYYEMNIGTSDLVNAQHWEMPDFDTEEDDYGKGVLPSETPYWNVFPSATHCKLYEYDEEDYYEYYTFTEQLITLIGAVDVETGNEAETEEIDLLIAPLPLDINSTYLTGDTIQVDDGISISEQQILPYGFGTLTTPDGDFEVLVFLDIYHFMYYPDEDEDDYNEEAGSILIFISKEGHQLNVWLEEGTDTEGEVDAEWIAYTHIVDNANDVEARDRAPSDFALFQNYPDPFNPSTNIRYALKQAGHVSLKVFDQLGKEVAVLTDEQKPAGTYEVLFDGSQLPSGSYLCQLQTGGFKATQKMMLMK
jgi:hypothetical protein